MDLHLIDVRPQGVFAGLRTRKLYATLAVVLVFALSASVASRAQSRDIQSHSARSHGVPAEFSVELSFSEPAAATLAATHEGVVVSASYAGAPRPSAKRHADEMGQINLGNEHVTAEGSTMTVEVPGRALRRTRLPWVKGPILLNVNVFSARRSSPDNILSCDFFDGELQRAVGAPIKLHCGLIIERPVTVQMK